MKLYKHNILGAIASVTVLLISSCQKQDYGIYTGEERARTTLKLSFNTPDMTVVSRAGLTDAQEKEITSLAVFTFDQNGILLTSAMHASITEHLTGGNSIAIPAISGAGRRVYAIANYDANIIENLKTVTTEADFKNLVVSILGNPIFREVGMTKIAYDANVDIPVDGKALTLTFKFISAKISVEVINKCSDLMIHSWSIGQVPLKSYIFEREMTNATDPKSIDAVDPNNDADFYNDFADQSLLFDEAPATNSVGSPGSPMVYKTTFYVSENRRGIKAIDQKTTPPFGKPTQESKYYLMKSWEAPVNATYIGILGRNTAEPSNPKGFFLKHYLGRNNHDNYNIERGIHYKYTITINNLGEVSIDSNIEQFDDHVPVRQGTDLQSLDAHATFRVFVLSTGEVPDKSVSVEVVNAVNSGERDWPNWLKISLLPTYFSQVRSDDPKIAAWQQSGNTGQYVRSKFIPHKSKRTADYALPSGYTFFNNSSGDMTGRDNPDYGSGTAYPEDDDVLPYLWAGRRMCNKITEFPKRDAPVQVYLYADEFIPTNGVSQRDAVIRVIYTPTSGEPIIKFWKITQRAPLAFMGLPGQTDMMVVENMEEYAHLTQDVLPFNQQLLLGMQWGSYAGIATSPKDGVLNTLQGVYSTVNSKTDYSLDTYLPKYGSLASGWSQINNGEIIESGQSTLSGGPLYAFYAYKADGTFTDDYYNSIYNSTAARYCHEKNWDDNGNGQIEPAEVKWYLPSQEELQMFWTYHERLNMGLDYYWSSTSADAGNAYAVSMLKSPADPGMTYNGVQQPLSKVTKIGKNQPRVRCVRRVMPTGELKAIKPVVNTIDVVIDCSNLEAAMYTNSTKYGISQSDIGSVQRVNDYVYKKLQIDTKQNVAVNYSVLHQQTGMCKEEAGWRLPTQREMLLIYSVKNELEAINGFQPFASGEYWSMTRGVSGQYIVDFANGGIAKYRDENRQGGAALYYRCVREMK